MTRSLTSLVSAVATLWPLTSRKTAVASHPSRSLPSNRARLLTIDCRSDAALARCRDTRRRRMQWYEVVRLRLRVGRDRGLVQGGRVARWPVRSGHRGRDIRSRVVRSLAQPAQGVVVCDEDPCCGVGYSITVIAATDELADGSTGRFLERDALEFGSSAESIWVRTRPRPEIPSNHARTRRSGERHAGPDHDREVPEARPGVQLDRVATASLDRARPYDGGRRRSPP